MLEFSEVPNNPYVGPSPFETKDKEKFFGRDLEAQTLFSLMVAERVVLFYAQSGAGKSSLVNAKIIPNLEKEYVVSKVRVGVDTGEMKNQVPNVFVYSALSSLAPPELNADSYARSQLLYYREWLSPENATKRRWLIFDQFEEILTTNQDRWDARRGFFEQLAVTLEHDRLLSVLFVIRSDYIAGLDLYADILPNQLRTRFYMELLKRPAALKSIQEPARKLKKFTNSAAELLVKKLCLVNTSEGERPGEYVEPVLLQVACRELWDQLEGKSTVEENDVREFEVEGALRHFYENIIQVEAINGRVSEVTIRRWFSEKLIVPPGIRGQIKRDEERSGELDTNIADRFVNSHLLRSEFSRGATWFELSHDRLVKPIVISNNDWFSAHENKYERLARAWAESKYIDNLLLTSIDLSQAEEWAGQQDEGFGSEVKYFLEKSRACEDKRSLEELAKQHAQFIQIAEKEKEDLEIKSAQLGRRYENLNYVFKRLIIVMAVFAFAGILTVGFVFFVIAKENGKATRLINEAKIRERETTLVLEKSHTNNVKLMERLELISRVFHFPAHTDRESNQKSNQESNRDSDQDSDQFFKQAHDADFELKALENRFKLTKGDIEVGFPTKLKVVSSLYFILGDGEQILLSQIPKKNESPSDSIFYVSKQRNSKDDWKYQYVAYRMLRAGLPVKVIMRTVPGDAIRDQQNADAERAGRKEAIGVTGADWGKNKIVVGTKKALFKLDCSLTVEDVKDPNKWSRCYDTLPDPKSAGQD